MPFIHPPSLSLSFQTGTQRLSLSSKKSCKKRAFQAYCVYGRPVLPVHTWTALFSSHPSHSVCNFDLIFFSLGSLYTLARLVFLFSRLKSLTPFLKLYTLQLPDNNRRTFPSVDIWQSADSISFLPGVNTISKRDEMR